MERICIIDDDEAVRDSLAVFLEACGYAVAAFASALALLDAGEIANYLCLFVDMHMPGLSGLELLEILRNRGVETPAWLITAAGNPGLRTHAAKLANVGLLEKPVEGDTLLDVIDGLARR